MPSASDHLFASTPVPSTSHHSNPTHPMLGHDPRDEMPPPPYGPPMGMTNVMMPIRPPQGHPYAYEHPGFRGQEMGGGGMGVGMGGGMGVGMGGGMGGGRWAP